ncbi:MAG: L,D-transpeptidase family protein, partial [Nevskiales bacterium]
MKRIEINLGTQALTLYDGADIERVYPVSTARNGPGEQLGSGCTPRGRHIVRAMIGQDMPVNTIFVGRRPTGEVYGSVLREKHPNRDWILTRILWLSGCEPGFNRLNGVDTMRRYIYIHGSPDEAKMGQPGSHGCIRMHNLNVLDLFNRVQPGTP